MHAAAALLDAARPCLTPKACWRKLPPYRRLWERHDLDRISLRTGEYVRHGRYYTKLMTRDDYLGISNPVLHYVLDVHRCIKCYLPINYS